MWSTNLALLQLRRWTRRPPFLPRRSCLALRHACVVLTIVHDRQDARGCRASGKRRPRAGGQSSSDETEERRQFVAACKRDVLKYAENNCTDILTELNGQWNVCIYLEEGLEDYNSRGSVRVRDRRPPGWSGPPKRSIYVIVARG